MAAVGTICGADHDHLVKLINAIMRIRNGSERARFTTDANALK
jgi:hypothetical protein